MDFMDLNELSIDEQIIKKYQEDERLMVRLFVQWCSNYKLDPHTLYHKAYPDQQENPLLQSVLDDITEDENFEIDNETMLDVLQMFGNYDLAFIITDEIIKQNSQD